MIYMDHNATTPIRPAVMDKMMECGFLPLNPSSVHSNGRQSKYLIEMSRLAIAKLLHFDNNFKDYQVTFTATGTEANNLVLYNYQDADIFLSSIEHLSIFQWGKLFPNVQLIKVDRDGIVDLEDLNRKLSLSGNNKKLLSVMLANNETGVIQPLAEIAKIAKNYGAVIHSDLVQAIGKIKVDIISLGIDFATISGHKFGGPAGAAALISKSKHHLKPIIIGGGQERGLRSGTENVLAIIGLGEAAEIALVETNKYASIMGGLRSKIEQDLLQTFPNIEIVGVKANRLPNTSLLINASKAAHIQLIAFDIRGVAVSSGSACSSGKVNKSHVLSAMGYCDEQAKSAIRISLGYTNTQKDIEEFLKIYKEVYG